MTYKIIIYLFNEGYQPGKLDSICVCYSTTVFHYPNQVQLNVFSPELKVSQKSELITKHADVNAVHLRNSGKISQRSQESCYILLLCRINYPVSQT